MARSRSSAWLPVVMAMVAAGCGSSGGSSGSGGSGGGMTASGGSTAATGGGAGGASGGASGGSTGGSATGGTGGTVATGGAADGGAAGHGTGGAAGAGTGGSATGGGAGTGQSGSAGSTGSGAPVKSTGCGMTAPTGGKTNIDVSGTSREYILTLPANYDPTHAYPLIIAFHGGSYDDQWVVDGDPPQSGPYYGIQSEAHDTVILVAPNALSGSWTNQGGRDIAFVNAMVTRFESQLCVDTSRIFATGFSMGGIMTISVGCNASSTFRAVAAMSGEIMSGNTCPDTRPIPYWASHGMMDPTIDISNGEAVRDIYLERNHCSMTQTDPADANGCLAYQGCDPGYPVVWCPFMGVHQPPPFAGAAIWSFLSQF